MPKMARPKRSGAAARVHDGDGDFNPTKKSPTKPKPTSPPNRNPSPRKGRKTEQQDTIDEGVAATSDDTSLQARVDKDGNIYEPSPQKVTTSTTTPLQTPLRKNAARNTPSRKTIVDQSSETFEAGQEGPASQADAAASSSSKSKIVVLKVAPHKLSEVIKAQTASNEDVNSKLAPTQLPPVKEEPVAGISVFPPLLQPEAPWPEEAPEMAPVKEKNAHDVLDNGIKEVIQDLYDIGSITHGYLPESHGPLVQKTLDFTRSLASLSALTAPDSTHPAAPHLRSILVPPEVIDYVAAGRNPDIYSREFVENVVRGNHVLNGKMLAFGSMAELYARETKSAMPDLAADMDRLMEHSGGFEKVGEEGEWKMKRPDGDGK